MTNTRKFTADVAPYPVIPHIADQVTNEVDAFNQARTQLGELSAEAADTAAAIDALNSDTTTAPTDIVAKRAELTETLRRNREAANVAHRQAKAKRSALNLACERALRSDESISLRRQIANNFRQDTAKKYAKAFDKFRADILEINSDKAFVRKSLAAELRTVPGTTRSGNFDASAPNIAIPQAADHALSTALAAIARFPFAEAIRRSITGEGGYDRLADWEWSPDDMPADIREEVASGLEARVGAAWLRGDFTRWRNRQRSSKRTK